MKLLASFILLGAAVTLFSLYKLYQAARSPYVAVHGRLNGSVPDYRQMTPRHGRRPGTKPGYFGA
jgi:hypothetical protein